jgi:hypothetical protein
MNAATLSSAVPAPSCGNGISDVWFTFSVPENGEVILDTDDLGIIDAALAVYRSTGGACGTNDLVLEEIAGSCVTDGSANVGAQLMPRVVLTGLVPQEQLWIRVMNESGNNGELALCLGRTDEPPFVPGVSCSVTLNLFDAGGDGWGPSAVSIWINGQEQDYSLVGGIGSIQMNVTQGLPIAVFFNANGADVSEVSYNITGSGGTILFNSGTDPANGLVFATTTTCYAPMPTEADCAGSDVWIVASPLSGVTGSVSTVDDLNTDNGGCLIAGEQNGHWYRVFMFQNGPFGMQITPDDPNTDMDFALWGPNELTCPPNTQPVRCSFSALSGPTGMDFSATDTSEGSAGDGWVSSIDVMNGDVHLLYVSTNTFSAEQFTIERIFSTTVPHDPVHTPQALAVYPNPTNGNTLSITTSNTWTDPPLLRILDSAGRVIRSERLSARDGATAHGISIEELAAGTYVIEVQDDSGSSIGRTRFVKLAQ